MEHTLVFKQEVHSGTKNSWLLSFFQSIEAMDISKAEALFDDDYIINDQSKWDFLSHLRDRFAYFKRRQVPSLHLTKEICLICNAGREIHFFEAYEGQGIGLKIDYNKEQLTDVSICNFSTGCMKAMEKLTWYKSHSYKQSRDLSQK